MEELSALVAACDGGAAALPPVVVALGAETAACARDLVPPTTTVLELGSRPSEAGVVEALEEQFGAGRLLF